MSLSSMEKWLSRGDSSFLTKPRFLNEAALVKRAGEATDLTRDWLLNQQHPDGYWCAELEGDTILESEYILLLAWLELEKSDDSIEAAERIRQQQLPDGGWAMYPGGVLEISGSVKAYFALKLVGDDPKAEHMKRARKAIRAAGGADRVNSFTRFYLALLGQISYDHCPAAPPEAMLLPKRFPISIYQISAWSRTILVPLTIIWAHRPYRELPEELGIDELFLEQPQNWPPLRCPGHEEHDSYFTWERFFRGVDSTLKLCERFRLRPLRKLALKRAERWMLDRFEDSDGLGAIFPPIIWSLIALKCLGYTDDSPEVRSCFEELDKLKLREPPTLENAAALRLQPCKSPVWDTAITLRALAAAGVKSDNPATAKAISWLLEKEVNVTGDWAVNAKAEPAGWFFEHRNAFYPDIDDTIMVMMAFREQTANSKSELNSKIDAACERGRRWVLAMQNKDGGWGAFDRDNDSEFLCQVPFADHNAMIDPSTPDIAARVVEALAGEGANADNPAIQKAIAFIRQEQEEDGAWYGRWGVNYLYGVWQTLVGLRAIGIPADDPAVKRGVRWLRLYQQECGGWGETADSYEDPSLRGQGPPTASQTAWALLGLIAAGHADGPSASRGVAYLLETQQADGTWDEPYFTGTGFPRVFYLRYHYYRIYFPLLALAQWRDAMSHKEES